MGRREEAIKAYIRTNFPNDANKIRASMNFAQLSRLVQDLSGGIPKVLGSVPDELRDERIFGSIQEGTTTTIIQQSGGGGGGSDLTIGTVQTGNAGSNAQASITDGQLNLTIPRGNAGSNGTNGTDGTNGADGSAATVAVGTVSTGAAGSAATVVNSGTTSAAILDFQIPQGAQGNQGIQGIQGIQGVAGTNGTNGSDGSAATIAVGTVSTLAAGQSATVVNSGTTSAAVLDFGIPQGTQGIQGNAGTNGTDGADGTAATIAVGTVSTLPAGSAATVSNSGTSSAAVFDFGIPQGASGGGGGGSGTIGGSIANQQIAVGSGTDTIGGSANLQFTSPNAFTLTTQGADFPIIQMSAATHAVSMMNREPFALHISDGVDDGTGLGGEITLATRATANYASSMTPLAGSLRLNADQTGTNSPLLRINTASGYLRLGPQNGSFCHFYTDRAYFYFNKPIQMDGGSFYAYNDDLEIKTDDSGSGQPTRIFVDAQVDECRVGIGNGFSQSNLPSRELHVNGELRIESNNLSGGGVQGGNLFITPHGNVEAMPTLTNPHPASGVQWVNGDQIDLTQYVNRHIQMPSDAGGEVIEIDATMPPVGSEFEIHYGTQNLGGQTVLDFSTSAGARVIDAMFTLRHQSNILPQQAQMLGVNFGTKLETTVNDLSNREFMDIILRMRYLGQQTLEEILIDPFSGEPIFDPNTGEPVSQLVNRPTFLMLNKPQAINRGASFPMWQFNRIP